MEAILKFSLPDEQSEFDMAIKGNDYHSVLWDFDQYLRGILKHGCDGFKDEDSDAIEKIRKQLHELLDDRGVKLDV